MVCEFSTAVGHRVSDNVDRVHFDRRLSAFDHEWKPKGDWATNYTRRLELFRQYGNFTMAYATLQPGMNYFEAHGGYLAYDTCLGVTFVLGDPVAPLENHPAIIGAFVRDFPHACFCQISRTVGAILADLGWFVNEFGADVDIELATYDFEGA